MDTWKRSVPPLKFNKGEEMNINEIKQMADDNDGRMEDNFAEVQMYTLIHIAKSLKQLSETLQVLNLSVQD